MGALGVGPHRSREGRGGEGRRRGITFACGRAGPVAHESGERRSWGSGEEAATRFHSAPPPLVLALRASRLGELRVRITSRSLLWSVRSRYGALLRWRLAAGAAPGGRAALEDLLREVETMKRAVHGR